MVEGVAALPFVDIRGHDAGSLEGVEKNEHGHVVGDGFRGVGCKVLTFVNVSPKGIDWIIGVPGGTEGFQVLVKVLGGDGAIGGFEVLQELEWGDFSVAEICVA